MTEPKLEHNKLQIAVLQREVVRESGFYLAGGSGLAIRLGHRFSEDLDWFTDKAFSANALGERLGALARAPSKIRKQGPHTLRAYYGTVETSFIRYTQAKPAVDLVLVRGQLIPVARVELLAVMKAGAVYNRGTKRDFIDVHAIIALPGWSMARFIEHATKAFPLSPELLARSLTYFEDAEQEPMPRGCSVQWAEVKADIQKAVRAWEQQRGRGLER